MHKLKLEPISTVCIKETAEIFKHLDERAAAMIDKDIYVDDLTSDTNSKEGNQGDSQKGRI